MVLLCNWLWPAEHCSRRVSIHKFTSSMLILVTCQRPTRCQLPSWNVKVDDLFWVLVGHSHSSRFNCWNAANQQLLLFFDLLELLKQPQLTPVQLTSIVFTQSQLCWGCKSRPPTLSAGSDFQALYRLYYFIYHCSISNRPPKCSPMLPVLFNCGWFLLRLVTIGRFSSSVLLLSFHLSVRVIFAELLSYLEIISVEFHSYFNCKSFSFDWMQKWRPSAEGRRSQILLQTPIFNSKVSDSLKIC